MTPQADRFAVVVRGDVRTRHSTAWDAEAEAARLRSLGFPAHAIDETAERERKRAEKCYRWPR